MQDQPPVSRFRAVAAGAAVGLLAGLAATVGRKAAAQATDALTGDWSDVLKAEHLLLAELFDLIDMTKHHQGARRRRLFARLRLALDKHAFQEESVIYPALKLADPDGPADRLFADHAEVKTLLYKIEQMSADDHAWIRQVHALRAAIEAHMREEEDVIFPHLQSKLSVQETVTLSAVMNRTGARLG
jgi:iron-sulfur cluster repair protein YtfE (RIC family)